MTSGLSEVDDDFADYVRARQHELLRAAYLVCGDEGLAEDALESALGAVSLRWGRVRDDHPDLSVRRVLYREAASGRRRASRDRLGPGDPTPWLSGLTAKQRAVAVLRHYEERTEVETAEVLGLSVSAVRHLLTLIPRDALQDAAEPVAERDFVERARRRARNRRQRGRQVWLAVAAAAVVLVGVLAGLPRGGTDIGLPRPSPSMSPPVADAPWGGGEFAVLGVRTQVGPTPQQMATLPRIDDLTRSQLALPEVLAFGPDTVIPTLSDLGGNGAPVRAVLLRHTEQGLRAVLVRPTLSNPYVLVDSIPLVHNVDEGGNTSEPLEVKAVADDRRHVMFLQPRKVLVLDAYTGDVQTFAVADAYLEQGGWAGSSVIAWSDTLRWRITPATGTVERLGQLAYPGRHQVQVPVEGPTGLRVLAFNEHGGSAGTRSGPPLLAAVWGATFTSDESTIATGGFLSVDAALAANTVHPDRLFQGVLTIDADRMTATRLLVAPQSEGMSRGCCEVLGWAYTDQVLVRWNTTQLLVWQMSTGSLRRVAVLPSRQEEPPAGSAAVSVAIAP